MDKWRRIVDQQIADAIGDGDVSHLPNAGKPLKLAEDAHTPEHQRAAFKIMQDNHVLPDWITEGKLLETAEADLRAELSARARRFRRDMQAAPSAHQAARVNRRWTNFLAEFGEQIERHNRKALTFNLKLPKGIPHKPILNISVIIASALEEADKESSAKWFQPAQPLRSCLWRLLASPCGSSPPPNPTHRRCAIHAPRQRAE